MRLGDKDHFWCPDCSTLLHRKLFSSHPAECSNKTESKHSNNGGSYATTADNLQPKEERVNNVHSFEINELTLSHLGNSLSSESINQEIKYTCQHCNFQSPYESTIKVHQKILHYVNEKMYTPNREHKLPAKLKHKINESIICSVCGATFTQRTSLIRHTEVKHGDVNNFPCNECGQ